MEEERKLGNAARCRLTRTQDACATNTSLQCNWDKMLQACAGCFRAYAVGQNGTLSGVTG